jgi:hypothetical protein
MVQRKVCGENSKMTCSGNVCWYTPVITPKFQWLRTFEIKDYSCQFAPRIIRSPHPDVPLFGAACTARDLSCSLHDSTIVWESNIIHDCPLTHVITLNLTKPVNTKSILINESNHLLFQAKNRYITICGKMFLMTEEGALLLKIIVQSDDLSQQQYIEDLVKTKNVNSNALAQFQLADKDYSFYNELETQNKIRDYVCNNFLSILYTFKNMENKFRRVLDSNGNNLILYVKNGNVIVPQCIEINKINVPDDIRMCYDDIPISFKQNNKTETKAFLRNTGIITKTSEETYCRNDPREWYFPEINKLVTLKAYRFTLESPKVFRTRITNKLSNITKLNIHHSNLVQEGFDTVKEIMHYNQVIEHDGDVYDTS